MLRRLPAVQRLLAAPSPASTGAQWLPWVAAVTALILYARAAAPGIITFFDDSLEFQVVAPTLGIAHPTGYPLYTLLGWLWTRLLPFGGWAGRMNLLSAAAAAGAVGIVAALGSRLVTTRDGRPNTWAGVAAAVALGLGPVWWSQATVAEVYTLHGLLTVAILTTTAGMDRTSAHGAFTPAFDRRMACLALLFGLGLAHHRMTALLALPVAVYLLWRVPGIWRPRAAWWLWAACLAAPLLLYLYIPLRAAAGVRDLNGAYVATWAGFWDHVLARSYGAFFGDNTLAVSRTPRDWLDLLTQQVGWLGLALGGVGLVWLVDRRARPVAAWVMVALALAVQTVFVLVYRVPDAEVFWLPALPALALFIGGGVGLVGRLVKDAAGSVLQALLVAALVVVPLGRGPLLDRRGDWTWHDQARRMAAAAFPPDSLVLGIEGEMTAIRYMQAAEGLGRAATPVAADDPAQRDRLLAQAVADGRPVYLTRELAGTGAQYSFGGDAALVRVWPRGHAQTSGLPSMPPVAVDAGRLQIVGYAVRADPYSTLPGWELTLHWRALEPLTRVLKLSLRVVDAGGQPLTGTDGAPLVADVFPLRQVSLTPEWLPGEVIQDVQYVAAPVDRHAERLLIVVYDAADATEVGRLEVDLPALP